MPLQYKAPYGDIFYFNTPSIDRTTQLLYNEEKQRQAKQEAANKALDDEFSKNVAGIRDADVNDLSRVYGDYKMAAKNLMKQKNGGTPQEQLELLRKKAEVYKTINESKQQKQYEEDVRQGLLKDSDKYEDTAHDTLYRSIKTPLSQLGDLKNHDYSYKGTNTDFQKILSTAAGQPKQVYQKEEALDGGLQFKITPYTYGNTPSQFKESVLNSLAQRKAGRDAAAIASQLDPAAIAAIQKEYLAIPQEKWQQMGVKELQDLIILPTDTKAEVYAKHEAQLYALNNEPKQGTPVFRDNKAALRTEQQGFELKKLAIQNANAKDLVRLRHNLTQGDKQLEDTWMDTYLDKSAEESRIQSNKRDVTLQGKKLNGYKQKLDPTLEKALGFDEKNKGELIQLDNGDYVVMRYKTDANYNPIKEGNKYIGETERTNVINKDQLKLALGVKAVGKKDLKSEMQNTKPTSTSITPAQWSKQWSNLKKGESMIGLDGQTYIKQ